MINQTTSFRSLNVTKLIKLIFDLISATKDVEEKYQDGSVYIGEKLNG